MGGIMAKSEPSPSISVIAWSDTMALRPANTPNKPMCQQKAAFMGLPGAWGFFMARPLSAPYLQLLFAPQRLSPLLLVPLAALRKACQRTGENPIHLSLS